VHRLVVGNVEKMDANKNKIRLIVAITIVGLGLILFLLYQQGTLSGRAVATEIQGDFNSDKKLDVLDVLLLVEEVHSGGVINAPTPRTCSDSDGQRIDRAGEVIIAQEGIPSIGHEDSCVNSYGEFLLLGNKIKEFICIDFDGEILPSYYLADCPYNQVCAENKCVSFEAQACPSLKVNAINFGDFENDIRVAYEVNGKTTNLAGLNIYELVESGPFGTTSIMSTSATTFGTNIEIDYILQGDYTVPYNYVHDAAFGCDTPIFSIPMADNQAVAWNEVILSIEGVPTTITLGEPVLLASNIYLTISSKFPTISFVLEKSGTLILSSG
jgi:hypothetical protein